MDSSAVKQYDMSVLESSPTYIAELIRQHDIVRETCIPCIVTAYDPDNHTVDVAPLPNHTRDSGKEIEEIKRTELHGIRLLSFSHGGFVVDAPVFVGDTGYVIACDRSCKKIIESNSTRLYEDDAEHELNKGTGVPDDCSLTLFSSGFFIPCSWASSEESEDNADERGNLVIKGIGKSADDENWQRVIFKNDGSITIEVYDRKITINKDGINFEGKTDAKVSLLTELRYDIGSHQIQSKSIPAERCGNIFVNVGEESDWEMIEGGQAVPVSESN